MKLLTLLLRRSRGAMLLTVLVGALSGAANAGLLALINEAIYHRASWPRAAVIASFIALCLTVPVTRILSSFLVTRLGQDAVHSLRMQTSRSLLSLPLQQLEKLGPHRLLVVLTDDLNAVSDALIYVPVVCINAFVVLGCMAFLAWLSSSMFLLFLVFLLLGTITYQFPMLRSVRRLRQAREEENTLYQHFQGLTQGNKELKLHRERQGAFLASLESSSRRLRELNLSSTMILSTAASWGQALFFILIGILLFATSNLERLNEATLVGYALVLLYMVTPIQLVLNAFPALGRANVAVSKVAELGLSLDSGPERSPAPERALAWQSLEMRDVVHSYQREGDNSSFHLGPIDLSFHPGEMVFIIGGNGSGKTTLLKLLVGLYAPERGEIRLDGRVIDEQAQEQYRQNFTVVFSDYYLFERLLGIDVLDLDRRAHFYLEQLQLNRQVEVRDGVLSTLNLSQGQRKRLALLTAYLEDREIYVFDEWAADQDPIFKEVFYYKLLPQLKERGKTIVVVTHDDRYFEVADRIIKMDSGKICDDQYTTREQRTRA